MNPQPVCDTPMATVLAITTSTEAAAVALLGPSLRWSVKLGAGRRHVEELTPAVRDLLAAASLQMSDLDAVVVDVGPGLFTGLRVGMATAGALAAAAGLLTVGVSSLDVLAAGAGAEPGRPLAAIVDARRSEVFWSWYPAGLPALDGPHVATPEQAVTDLAGLAKALPADGAAPLLVGDGAGRYTEAFESLGPVMAAAPDALALAHLGAQRVAAGHAVEAGTLQPLYLREADAVANFPTLKPVSVGGSTAPTLPGDQRSGS